jgi:putative ABC transport system permease protein
MREFVARIVDWFRRDALERELAEETQFHRMRLEQDALAQGTPPAETRRIVRRRFGNEMRVAESTRDRWSIAPLDVIQQDARYALRGLLRAPAFSLTIITTLALGIGANAAMFGVVDRLWFRPIDLMRDEAMVSRVYQQWVGDDGKLVTSSASTYQRHVDIRDKTTLFTDVAGFSEFPLGVGEGDAARERSVAAVSPTFFRFYDAQPVAGRFILASDDTPPVGAAVAVLTYDFWQKEFGGRDVIGEKLQVGDVRTEIIGVAPRGLSGFDDFRPVAVFIPAATLGSARGLPPAGVQSFYRYHPWNSVVTLVRRKPGVTIADAEAEVTRVVHASWETERVSRPIGMFRDAQSRSAVDAKARAPLGGVRRAAGPDRPPEMQSLFWISGVALLVLVIACANVLNLMLARALKRQREIAMRVALGVSRARLLMQAVTEGTILALASGAAGLIVAHWGGAAIRELFVGNDPAPGATADARILLVVFGLSLLVGLVTGLAQVLLAQRGDLATTLRAGGKALGAPRARFRTALLVLQGALSVVLLVGAALFIGSLRAAQSVPKGYDLSRVLVASPVFRSGTAGANARAAHQSLLETARAQPGVAHASLVSGAPLWRTGRFPLFVPGIDSVSRLGEFTANAVSSSYFDVMSTRILRGRPITTGDNAEAAPVAVVSLGMAEALWPGQDALGRCMRVGADTLPCTTVVGVSENIVQSNYQLGEQKRYHYYLAVDQIPATGPRFLLVNVAGSPAIEVERVRKALQAVMPGTSYVTVRPMETLLDSTYRTWRLGASMFLCFGLLALIVASVGLYGLIGYEVTQRMHELGVRVALGARRHDIVALVVGRTIRLVVAGIVIGGSVAFFASRWLEPLLFRQSVTDARVYALVGATMLLVALVASAAPALRASQADPNRSLRTD